MEKMVLVSALCLALTACGGNSHNTSIGTNNENPSSEVTNPTGEVTSSVEVKPTNNYISEAINKDSFSQRVSLDSGGRTTEDDSYGKGHRLGFDINPGERVTFVIPVTTDNTTQDGGILTYNDGIKAENSEKVYSTFMISSEDAYQYSQFGFIDGQGNRAYAFSHGRVVTSMPVDGERQYNGEAIVARLQADGSVGQTEIGQVQLNVDFLEKDVDFSLSTNSGYRGTASADIEESGLSNTTVDQTKTINGKFYGPNAEEVSGVYFDKAEKIMAPFGARQQ